MPGPVPGWPLWQRVNFISLTIGGGCLGFYIEDKIEKRRKVRLQMEVPKLGKRLDELINRRKALEKELAERTAAP